MKIEITTRGYPREVPTPEDMPTCKCGGIFKVYDIYNKKGVHKITSVDCGSCGEHFVGYNSKEIAEAVRRGQKFRETPSDGLNNINQ